MDAQRRPDHIRIVERQARDGCIRIAHLDHHGGEEIGFHDPAAGVPDGHPIALAQLAVGLSIGFKMLKILRVHDQHVFVQAQRFQLTPDHPLASNQDGNTNPLVQNLSRSPDDLGFFTFRKGDALLGCGSLGFTHDEVAYLFAHPLPVRQLLAVFIQVNRFTCHASLHRCSGNCR